MASVRQIASCIGLPGDISVVRDFFGYATAIAQPLSLLTQVKRVQGKHFHVNHIRVAIDGGEWDLTIDEFNLDQAVLSARDIFATVGLGIGRVQRFFVPVSEHDGHLADPCEGIELTDEWTAPNDGIDVFWVLSLGGGHHGFAPLDGPCDKDDGGDGIVIDVKRMLIIKTLAHELAHYLGLEHIVGHPNNLMQDPDLGQVQLTGDQGNTMRSHCVVKPGC